VGRWTNVPDERPVLIPARPTAAGRPVRHAVDRTATPEAALPAWIDAAGDAFVVFDRSGTVQYVNLAAARVLGADGAAVTGATLPELVAAHTGNLTGARESWLGLHELLPRVCGGRVLAGDELVLPLPDGSVGTFLWRLDPVRVDGEVTHEVLVLHDTTRTAGSAFQAASTPLFKLDAEGRLTAANWACRAVFGIVGSSTVLPPLRDLVHPEDAAVLDAWLAGFRDGRREQFRAELRFVRRGGRLVWCVVAIDPPRRGLVEGPRSLDRLSGALEDITARKQLDEKLQLRTAELERLSRTDALTGLYNRRHMDERLAQAGALAGRHGRPLSVLMVDVDRFKQINDTYGHDVGDLVLVTVAERLGTQIRTEDVLGQWEGERSNDLGRWGGEEFLLILPEIGLANAQVVAERLRALVEATTIELADGRALGVTVSVGVASDVADGLSGLLRRADVALYRAKAAGRNRTVVDDGVAGDAPPQ
jgi:diguanylate cyclase (GGDEF)-like protein/PAS domain S-box-containing protein